ncbi:MAG: hypothetical protein ACW99A_01620 [Candidatus Kariarchaeaceae archaeon]
MSSLDVLLVTETYELYTRIQNEKRKQLLSYIYAQSRKYKELIEFSNLKPGSLYHHLNILEPLIEKRGHGKYHITDLGITIVEALNLIDTGDTKPKISSDSIPDSDIKETDTKPPNGSLTHNLEDNLSLLWLGKTNYVILGIILIMSISMALQGIALAGSAIYATGVGVALKFDVAAFVLGILALYTIEKIKQSYPVYKRTKYIITIRLMSMVPGTVISIGLLLLFSSDIVPADTIYPWLFTISLILGTLTTAIGISYLRGVSIEKAADLAILIGIIDLLLGIVILLS